MKVRRLLSFNLRCLVLIVSATSLVFPAFAWAESGCTSADLAELERVVSQLARLPDLPLDADTCLPNLRRYCYSPEAEQFRAQLKDSARNDLLILLMASKSSTPC